MYTRATSLPSLYITHIIPDAMTSPSGAHRSIGVGLYRLSRQRELRLLGILGSPFAGCCIRTRNTPARWPWVAPIRARGGRYYLGLDAYASIWMPPADANSCPRQQARQT